MGRWTTTDPDCFKDGLNLYAYVHNRPLTAFDSFGLKTTDPVFDSFLSPERYYRFSSKGYRGNRCEGVWDKETHYTRLEVYKARPSPLRFWKEAFGERPIIVIETEIHKTEYPDVFRVGKHELPHRLRALYNHGMQNTRESAISNGILLSETMGGGDVDVITHPGNMLSDVKLFCHAKLYRKGDHVEPIARVADLVHRNYREGYNSFCIGHSLGALLNERAFRYEITDEKVRKSIYSVTCGGAQFVDEELVRKTYNYVQRFDFVPWGPLCEERECRKALFGLPNRTHVEFVSGKSHSWNQFDYHRFDNPDYLDVLQQRYDEIVKQ